MKAADARRALENDFEMQQTEAESSATGNGCMPVSMDDSCPRDVEMCTPTAVITDSHRQDDEKEKVLENTIPPLNQVLA